MIPLSWRIGIIAVAVLGVATALLWIDSRRIDQARQAGRSEVRAQWAESDLKRSAEASRAQAQATRDAATRYLAIQEIADAEVVRRQSIEADAAGLRAEHERLRAAITTERRRAAAAVAAATAAGRSAPAGPDTGMLSDLLGQCSGRVVALAAEADRTRAAGAACERAWGAVIE